ADILPPLRESHPYRIVAWPLSLLELLSMRRARAAGCLWAARPLPLLLHGDRHYYLRRRLESHESIVHECIDAELGSARHGRKIHRVCDGRGDTRHAAAGTGDLQPIGRHRLARHCVSVLSL